MFFVRSLRKFLTSSTRTHNIRDMATLTDSATHHLKTQELTFNLPWGNIAGKLWGNSDSEKKIMAIHGFLENAGSFDRLAPLLFANDKFSKTYSILAIDLAGHGYSSARPDGAPYLFINYIIDLKHIIQDLGWKKYILMGHSLGGSISTLYSSSVVDQVERLILIDSGNIFTFEVDTYFDMLKNLVQDVSNLYIIPDTCKIYPTMDAILARIREGNKLLNEAAVKVLAIRGTKKVENGYILTRDIRLNSRNPIYFLSDTPSDLFHHAIKHLTMPTLCIIASECLSKRVLLQKELPDKIEVKEAPGNHHVHTNTPEIIAPLILEFLACL